MINVLTQEKRIAPLKAVRFILCKPDCFSFLQTAKNYPQNPVLHPYQLLSPSPDYLLRSLHPLPLSAITMILNVVLLIIGFLTCGREFGVKTVYTSIMLPVFIGIFEKIFAGYDSMTGSQELDVICYILVVSVGLSILFNRNASSFSVIMQTLRLILWSKIK